MYNDNSNSATTNPSFIERSRIEFIEGSAISPELYDATTEIIEDTGRWEPNYALGLYVATQWNLHQPHAFCALIAFINEDGSLWHSKPENPMTDKDGKKQKYQAKKGNGSKVFMPAVPVKFRRKIAQRYGIEVPETGLFWEWAKNTPGLTFTHTEGGKKGLSLLSEGYIPISLYGVNAGYRVKDNLGNSVPAYLIEDVLALCHPTSTHIIAFDQDKDEKTRQRVAVAVSRYSRLLEATGGAVLLARWDGRDGKGIDDLAANRGRTAVDAAIAHATPLGELKLQKALTDRLKTTASLRLKTHDLSTLSIADLPKEGIIAISSPKGTGKTKFMAVEVQGVDKVAALTHRVALGRNLCDRLGLNYRGDLDKHNGKFIGGSGYTLKVGTCVDSLLALNPEAFIGCDLIVDEVGQVMRHLLTSSTTNKDGKRPILLSHFTELLRVARRVILADADLDDATIQYIQTLRKDGQKPFLIRNDIETEGYPVQFLQSSDATAALGELLKDIEAGLNVFVATDSLRGSKNIAGMIERLGVPVLLINSETSGNEFERAFITRPDENMAGVRAVVTTGSMGTGTSIEVKHFDRVYGLFFGASSTDGDMAQALGRVRDNAPRTVWCAQYGRGFSSVSRSTVPFVMKAALKDKFDTTAALIRLSLRSDTTGLEAIDWQNDPHLNLWAKIEADKNRSMGSLRKALLVRLRHEGNKVMVIDSATDGKAKALLAITKEEIKEREMMAILNAEILTPDDAKRLDGKENLTPHDRLALRRYYLCDFYCLDTHELTLEDIALDSEGRFRAQIQNLEHQLTPGLAIATDIKAIERQQQWKKGLTPWDASTSAIKREMREALGLDAFLNLEARWTKYDLEEFAEKCRKHRSQIKAALNYTFHETTAINQVLGDLLSQMGVKTKAHKSRSVEGHEGEIVRVYGLDSAHWQRCLDIVQRRKDKRVPNEPTPPLMSESLGVALLQTTDITQGLRAIYTLDDSPVIVTFAQGPQIWVKRLNFPLNNVAFLVKPEDLRPTG